MRWDHQIYYPDTDVNTKCKWGLKYRTLIQNNQQAEHSDTLTVSLLFSLKSEKLWAFVGRIKQSGPNPNEESRGVVQSIIHPSYDFITKDNDIALLRLSAPVNFTDYIYPVCLASANSTFHNGTSSWVAGWGVKDDGKLTDSQNKYLDVS